MKQFIPTLLLAFLCTTNGNSQTPKPPMFLSNGIVFVGDNPPTTLYINGTLKEGKNTSNSIINIHNGGTIIVTDSIISLRDSLFYTSSSAISPKTLEEESEAASLGTVNIFRSKTSDTIQYIKGNKIRFCNLDINNNIGLLSDIKVFGNMTFSDNLAWRNNIYLKNKNIELYDAADIQSGNYDKGILNNENEKHRIMYDTGSIKAFKKNIDSAKIGLSATSADFILAERTHFKQNNVTEGSINKCYKISTPHSNGNLVISNIKIQYLDTDFDSTFMQEDFFKIWSKLGDDANYDKLTSKVVPARNEISTDNVITIFNSPTSITVASEKCKNSPVFELGANKAICENDTVTFDLSKIKAFEQGNFHFIWKKEGKIYKTFSNSRKENKIKMTDVGEHLFIVTAVTNKGCEYRDSIHVIVHPRPIVGFKIESENSCVYNHFQFTDTSKIKNTDNISFYHWDFGDGSKSDTNTLKKFNKDGTYKITLTCTSANGCVASSSRNLTVYPKPIAAFGVEVKNNFIRTFNDETSYPESGGTRKWDFGDQTMDSSNIINPKHEYGKMGSYTVVLQAKSKMGCRDTIEHQIVIDSASIASFIPSKTEVCSNEKISFQNLSTIQGKVTYEWNFGDGSASSTVFEPDKIYKAAGTYKVILTARRNDLTLQSTSEITVRPLPEINFKSDTYTCNPFYELKPTTQSSTIIYQWSDNSVESTLKVSIDGVYGVTLTDSHGCINKETTSVHLNSYLYPMLGKDTVVCGSILLKPSLANVYNWSNGSHEQNLLVTQSGQYSVEIIDKYNCKGTDTINITIIEKVIVNLGNDTETCSEQPITINALNSQYPNATYLWSNGSTESSINVNSSGTYSVVVSNDNMCSGSDSVWVTIKPSPVFDLGADKYLCSNQETVLQVEYYNSQVLWESDNGLKNKGYNIKVQQPGLYYASVTTTEGCSYYDTIRIYSSTVNLVPDFLFASEAKAGDTIAFIEMTAPTPVIYQWSFGDGDTSSVKNPFHIYYYGNTFDVTLSVSDGTCFVSKTKQIDVENNLKLYNTDKALPKEIKPAKLLEIVSADLFSNPNNGHFTFEIETSSPTDMNIYFYDISGYLLYAKELKSTQKISELYNFENLKQGIYLFKVFAGTQSRTFKVIIIP